MKTFVFAAGPIVAIVHARNAEDAARSIILAWSKEREAKARGEVADDDIANLDWLWARADEGVDHIGFIMTQLMEEMDHTEVGRVVAVHVG